MSKEGDVNQNISGDNNIQVSIQAMIQLSQLTILRVLTLKPTLKRLQKSSNRRKKSENLRRKQQVKKIMNKL